MYLEFNNKKNELFKLIPLNHESEDDFKTFKEIICDPVIMKTASLFNGEVNNNDEILRKYFNIMSESNSTHNIGVGKILDKKNNLIGISGFGVVKADKKNNPEIVELIYFMKEPYWNRGIGSNVSLMLMEYLFINYPNIKEILGIALADNYSSQIIMLKLGFKFVGKYLKRGSLINYHTLNKEIYQTHFMESTQNYVNFLNQINKNNGELKEIDDFVI